MNTTSQAAWSRVELGWGLDHTLSLDHFKSACYGPVESISDGVIHAHGCGIRAKKQAECQVHVQCRCVLFQLYLCLHVLANDTHVLFQ